MEFEQFIRQDIIRFLDSQKQEAPRRPSQEKKGVMKPEELLLYAPGHDYARDLDEALKKHDLEKAKRIIHAFKEHYEQFPPNSPEWDEGKRLFKSLYNAFREAVDKDGHVRDAHLEQYFTPLASHAKVESHPPPPGEAEPSSQSKAGGSSTAPASAKEAGKTHGAARGELARIKEGIDHVRALLAKEPSEALSAYKELRQTVHPEQLGEERGHVVDEFQTLYAHLQLALRERHEFDERAKAIQQALALGNLADAMRAYHELHDLYAKLPPERQQQRHGQLLALYERIAQQRGARSGS